MTRSLWRTAVRMLCIICPPGGIVNLSRGSAREFARDGARRDSTICLTVARMSCCCLWPWLRDVHGKRRQELHTVLFNQFESGGQRPGFAVYPLGIRGPTPGVQVVDAVVVTGDPEGVDQVLVRRGQPRGEAQPL